MFSAIWNWFKRAVKKVVNFIGKIISGILNFMRNVVSWFQGLNLEQKRHTPFVANLRDPEIKALIKQAPRKAVGIFKGVYDEVREEIVHHEIVEADSMDSQTKKVLGNEPIVVLQ